MEDQQWKWKAESMAVESAFPHSGMIAQTGMTKREYIAAQAMQGLLAYGYGSASPFRAVEAADQLLQELAKPKQ